MASKGNRRFDLSRLRPGSFGGGFGLLVVAAGLLVIGIGWNGAAGTGGQINGQTDLRADVPCRPLVVAGQDLELDPQTPQARDRLRRVGLRRVGEDEKAEQHELLLVALVVGRACENGKPVPVQDPTWVKLTQELREASMSSYRAALTKSQEKIADSTNDLADACLNCHQKYRSGPISGPARCTAQ